MVRPPSRGELGVWLPIFIVNARQRRRMTSVPTRLLDRPEKPTAGGGCDRIEGRAAGAKMIAVQVHVKKAKGAALLHLRVKLNFSIG